MVRVGGDTSDGVEFDGVCIIFLTVVLNCFVCLCGGVYCVLVHPPSEVGMVTPSGGCVSVLSDVGVDCVGIIPCVFARVTRWCLRGAKCI